MSINIPQKAQALSGGMQTRQTIELPFPAPAWYVINGNADLEDLKNSLYYGGWACSVENVKKSSEKYHDLPFPIPGTYEVKRRDDKGNPYQVLTSRSLVFASIGMRMFSVAKINGREQRVAAFTKGASPSLQVLGILGYKDEKKQINPYAPVMLKASGYQVNHVRDAFNKWRKAITPHVKKIAPNADLDAALNLFWLHIGTFGERHQVEAGHGKFITPITAYIPDELTEAQVENMYVGDPMAEFMADIKIQADEWLKAYQQPEKVVAVDVTAAHEEWSDEPPPPEDDIPF